MPIGTPFHERTQPLCHSYRWKEWAGYHAVCSYDVTHDREYSAIRQGTGVIDVSGLFKYDIRGKDAAAFLSRVTVRDISKLKVGRVTYLCWCDDQGWVIDDGTCMRFGEDYYRLTAAEPTYWWLKQLSRGFDIQIEDVSATKGALALQGPTSREVLRGCTDADMDALRFFGATTCKLDGRDVQITRTGYTGDLGYEVWADQGDAVAVWDAIFDAGKTLGIEPAGLDAMDVTRVEAGFIMLGVDFYSAPMCTIESRKSTPFELGLGWTVKLGRGPFVGAQALARLKGEDPAYQIVGLDISWPELEKLYEEYGLPPSLPAFVDREPIPVYHDGVQVGRATSHTWSPILKKYIALASVKSLYSKPGTRLQIEHTVEWSRRSVSACVCELPFFDPERKRKP